MIDLFKKIKNKNNNSNNNNDNDNTTTTNTSITTTTHNNNIITFPIINDSDNSNNKYERSFWFIWRNKYLIKKIFLVHLKSKFKLQIYNYEQCISVTWILKQNYINLLKLKVKRCDYLIFNKEDNQESQQYNIFNKIKDDPSFYKNFFKNYPQESKQQIDSILKHDCLVAYKIYIEISQHENYNNHNKESLLLKSIEYNSFEIANFIKDQQDTTTTELSNKIWEILKNKTQLPTLYGCTEFIVSKLKIKPPKDLNLSILFDIRVYNLKLSELIQLVQTTTLLKDQLKSYISSINQGSDDDNSSIHHLLKKELPIRLIDLGEIDKIKQSFSVNEMELKVCDFNFDNSIVKKLFFIVLPFIQYKHNICFLDNYLFYQIKYKNTYMELNQRGLKFDPISFGDYNKITNWSENYNYHYQSLLFEYCKKDTNKQTNFINNAINDILDSKVPQNKKYTPQLLMELVIKFDNLNLIKLVYNRLEPIYKFQSNVFSIIESTLVFDYIYLKIQKQQKSKQHSQPMVEVFDINQIFPLKINLSNHFKLNYHQDFIDSLGHLKIRHNINFIYQIDAIKFIYENIQDHPKLINIWNHVSLTNIELDDFKLFVTNSNNGENIGNVYKILRSNKVDTWKKQTFLNWLLNEYNGPLSIDISLIDEQQLLLYNYYNGFILDDPITHFQNLSMENKRLIYQTIGDKGDIETLNVIIQDLIINTNNNQDEKRNLLYNLLLSISKSGHSSMIKFLGKRFPILFSNSFLSQLDIDSINLNLTKFNYIKLYNYFNKIVNNFKIYFV